MKTAITILMVSLLCLVASVAATAELGAEDVQLPDRFQHTVFATTGGALITVGETSGVISMYRSTDNGVTWSLWSTIGDDANPDTDWSLCDVLHVDAATEQVFVAVHYSLYIGGSLALDSIIVARADPSLDTPVWNTSTVASDGVFSAVLAADAANYADYNVYCAFLKMDANGNDIWFSRSLDKGVNFEAPYVVAATSTSDRDYKWIDLDYGFAGFLHLVWVSDPVTTGEAAIMYRYGSGRGSSLSWGSVRYLTSITDGTYESSPSVAANPTDGTVVVCYQRTGDPGPGEIIGSDTEMIVSSNYGGSFSGPTVYSQMTGPRVYRSPEGYAVLLNDYVGDRAGLLRPTTADPGGSWAFDPMLDQRSASAYSATFDPGKSDRWCMVGGYVPGGVLPGVQQAWFDAEWFRDPGYPVLIGDLPDGTSDVCLADLTGDGDPEIIYTSAFTDLLYAFDGSLQPVPGFPVPLAITGGSSSQHSWESLVCGDVNGDGDPEIFVGNLGVIYGFDHQGNLLPGWPVDLNSGYLNMLTLGTVSRSSPLDIIVAAGNRIDLLRIDGSERTGSPILNDPATLGGHVWPVAVGDVDADGDVEMVATLSRSVVILGPTGTLERVLWSDPNNSISAMPARLVDMDRDGDLEIAFSVGPTLYLMHHDGSTFGPTWPWTEPEGRAVTPLAFANNLGTAEPEMFFAAWTGTSGADAYAMSYNGTIPAGWPNHIGTGHMAGVPLVDRFAGFPSSEVYLPLGGTGYAFKNFFGGLEGWPHPVNVPNWTSGASGDLDGDGLVEFVAPGSMKVYATHGAATSDGSARWPQARFDSEGSSCADCQVDRVSATPDGPVAVTRVAFRGGYPNPFSSRTVLNYELPAAGAVRLVIYDVRGRRVREILRSEQDGGPHAMAWDRTDDHGRPVPGGTYLAKLTARGPGLDEVVTRKITVLR